MNSNSTSNSMSASRASRVQGMAALRQMLRTDPVIGEARGPPKVFHWIDPKELKAKADRIALWSAWSAMRAEDAARKAEPSRARKAEPSRARPPSLTSTRLTLEGLTRPPFKPIGNRQTRALTESTLTYLARRPFPPLRDFPSPGDYAAAQAKGPDTLHQLTEKAQRLIREAVIAST